MDDTLFRRLTELYGFAPNRSLRELIDAAVKLERLECARVCEGLHGLPANATPDDCAKAIRARGETK